MAELNKLRLFFSLHLKFGLLILLLPVFYAFRKTKEMPMLLLAYCSVLFLTVLSLSIFLVRYDFIPVYALLFASSRSYSSLALAFAVSAVCLIPPEGDFQLVLALITILLTFVIIDRKSKEKDVILSQ